jgi:hypothetical protein
MLTAKKITAIDSVYFSAVDALYVKALTGSSLLA